MDLKVRLKGKTIHSTEAMTFFSETPLFPNTACVLVMNTPLISHIVNTFINATVHCTTGDAKQIPVVIPTPEILLQMEALARQLFALWKAGKRSESTVLQQEANRLVADLYGIECPDELL